MIMPCCKNMFSQICCFLYTTEKTEAFGVISQFPFFPVFHWYLCLSQTELLIHSLSLRFCKFHPFRFLFSLYKVSVFTPLCIRNGMLRYVCSPTVMFTFKIWNIPIVRVECYTQNIKFYCLSIHMYDL